VVGEDSAAETPAYDRPALEGLDLRPSNEQLVEPFAGRRESPLRSSQLGQGPRPRRPDVEIACEDADLARPSETVGEARRAEELGVREAVVGQAGRVQVRQERGPAVGQLEPHRLADATLFRPGEPGNEVETKPSCLSSAERAAVQHNRGSIKRSQPGSDENCVRLAGERRPEKTVIELSQAPPQLDARRNRTEPRRGRDLAVDGHARPVPEPLQSPDRHLLEAQHVGLVSARQPHHLLEERVPLGREGIAVKDIPGPDQQPG